MTIHSKNLSGVLSSNNSQGKVRATTHCGMTDAYVC